MNTNHFGSVNNNEMQSL